MTLSKELLTELQGLLEGDVSISEVDLTTYSHDTSLFKVPPSAVIFPKSAHDVEKVVEFVAKKKSEGFDISITGRSAGTDMTGGPLTTSLVIVFTKYMNHMGNIIGSSATAEPGMLYRDFEKETLKKDLLLPSYPASRELCAIGGIVANNSGGEKTLTYGKTEDYVEALDVVLSDGKLHTFKALTMEELRAKEQQQDFEGEIYRRTHELIEKNYDALQAAKPRVSKNSAGYMLWNILNKEKGTFDLTRLFVGSQGTLGLHTSATFHLVKPKTHSRLLVLFLKKTDILPSLINHVLEFKPESFESYDDHTFKIALKMFPQIVKRLGGSMISLGFQFLPEFWAIVTGGIPKLVMLAEFTGDSDEEAYKKALEAQKSVLSFNIKTLITSTEAEAEKYWVVRRESFNLLRQRVKNMRTACFIDDLIVKPIDLPQFIPELYSLLDSYNLTYTIAGHMGDANFHIIPLMDLSKESARATIYEITEKVYHLVFKYKGSITAEHNDGLMRTPYLEEMFGPTIYKLFEEVKNIFDPLNIFNPGKKVFGSLAFAKEHVDIS
jgi:FAD/FMN-containing dehydrogenase